MRSPTGAILLGMLGSRGSRPWFLPPMLALVAVAPALGCRAKAPAIDAPFADDFERGELGGDWNATAPAY